MATAVFGLLAAGLVGFLVSTSRRAQAEAAAMTSKEAARQALRGFAGEFAGKTAAVILPGSNDRGVGVVLLEGPGYPVLRQGYSPTALRIRASETPRLMGEPAVVG